jgi:hypothetical protein
VTRRPLRVCLLGLENLPAMAPQYATLGVAAGEPVQQSLLAKALARRGCDVTMVVLDSGQVDAVVDGVKLRKAYRLTDGIRVVRFFHPRWSGVLAALASAEADAYYTSCAGIQAAQIAQAARRRRAVSVFRIASDSDCEPSRLLVPWHSRGLYGYGLRRADAVLAQTESQRQALRRNYGRDSRIARMFVDTGRSDLPFDRRTVSALWVSNLRDVKRPDRLLALARAESGIAFEMIGGTQPHAEDLYRAVEREARSLANVQFAGPVPYHEIGVRFERARVLVNTSDVEGFPNTFLQAWMRGVPVVSLLDPDGIIAREGLGIAARSESELREAVRVLATDATRWRDASERCVRYMQREYDEARILEPYLEALSGLSAGQ